MDELLKQGCRKVIQLAIDIDPEMSIKIFYDKMTQQEIDGRCFTTSTKTVMRYLEVKKEAGRNYDRFLKYSAKILDIGVKNIIEVAKHYIEYKDSEPEDKLLDDIKSYIKYVKSTQLPTFEHIGESLLYQIKFMQFLKNSEENEIQRLHYLHNKCRTGFSNEMLSFLSRLFSDEEENRDKILKFKDKLRSTRIRIHPLNIHQNKDLCTLFAIQHHYEHNENDKKREYNFKDREKLLWVVDFHFALKETRDDLDIIFKYALLNPQKNKRWIIS